MIRPVVSVLVLALGSVIAVHATEDVPGLTASARRPRLPILIGNAYGPMVRVVLDVGKEDPGDAFPRNDLRLTSITFVLDGTDDLGDIESLSLLSSGDDDELRQGPRRTSRTLKKDPTEVAVIGRPVAPAKALTFHADQPLQAGDNVFWLSCRLRDSANLIHKLKATCTAIGTSGGWLTAPDEDPDVRQRIGIALRKAGDDGVDTYGIPSIARSAKSTLLSVYDMRWNFPGHDLQDHITTGLSRSADGGRTWEPMRDIMDMGSYGGLPPAENGCSDPGIIVDRKTGEIFVFAVWMHGKPGHHQWVGDGGAPGFEIGQSPQFLMVRSRDDGRTWSRPENLTRKLKRPEWWLLTTSPESGIQLSDGTLVMPIQGRDARGKEFSTIMTSRNDGANWTVGSPVSGGSECQVVQLGDGSLMLNIRNEREGSDTFLYRLVYVTTDFGRTWRPHPTNGNTLIEPNCNGSLIRVDYAKGRHVLLFSNPRGQTRGFRNNQTIEVSFDDGSLWPMNHYQLLDEEPGWGYPSLVRIDDGTIGIVYGGSQADIVFQELPLAELLRGGRK